jgi:hypothetical protein
VSGTDFATALAEKQDVLEQPGFGATLLYGNRVKRVGFGAGITGGTDAQPDGTQTLSLAVSSSLTLNNLTLNGSLVGWTPFFSAGSVDGTDLSILSSSGVGFTVSRNTSYPVGVYQVTFASPHPTGSAYTIILNSRNSHSYLTPAPITGIPVSQAANFFHVTLRNVGATATTNEQFHFMVLR